MKRVPNRRPASKHLVVIDNLNTAIKASGVTVISVAKMLGKPYQTTDKYLKKERNVNDLEVVKRMMVLTDVLNTLTRKGKLPIDPVTSRLYYTSVILDTVCEYLEWE